MVTLRPRKRLPLLLAGALILAVLPARAEEPGPPGTVVRSWLALDPVDRRGRVPFNANTPFLRHLLDRASPPPSGGESMRGDLGPAHWRVVQAKEDGTVEDENGAWFYGEVERPKEPAEAVFLAHIDGASALFVNGAGFVGDVYRLKTGPVPVSLRAGTNRLFVVGPRGPWRLRFEPWAPDRSPLLREDATLPDVLEGDAAFAAPVSLRLVNATTSWQSVGIAMASDPPSPEGVPLPPLWTGKALGEVIFSRGVGRKGPVRFGVRPSAGKREWPEETFDLEMRTPHEARRVTFLSRIDGSAQFYGYLPPAKSDLDPEAIGTVLTLHGAGVDALGQARAYAPKPDFRIVAPTNRRPFGFDWQDWGEQDAYEVLDAARRTFGPLDMARVCLTGHSMGGHGTWHLAANNPDFWLAIAPSAGWCSFDTYGGGPRPATPLTPIWRGCDGGSRTEDLVANLVALPTFVLHGTKDDNVPLAEAEGMIRRIETAGGKPLRHFQEGAGHWWDGDAAPGADCVDWPGIFDLFRKAAPAYRMREEVIMSYDGPIGPPAIDWVSASPSLDRGHFWFHVDQPLEYGKPVRARARWTGTGVEAATENARTAVILCPAEAPLGKCILDGQALPLAEDTMVASFRREGDRWTVTGEDRRTELHLDLPEGEKGWNSSGPFKRAFDRSFVLVVGTKGTDEENREMMELARYHAATWWYRANGNAPVVRDTDLLARGGEFGKRNLILYGNADVNAAWAKIVPASCPVKARRGALSVGKREWKGEGLGAVFVHPRADGGGLVGAFASTGARGTRVGYGLLPFVSGVGYPDYAVYGEEFLRSGDGGVLAAGWFDHRWGLQPGGFLGEETK